MEDIEKGTSGRHADSANGSNKAYVNLRHSSTLREYASVYKGSSTQSFDDGVVPFDWIETRGSLL